MRTALFALVKKCLWLIILLGIVLVPICLATSVALEKEVSPNRHCLWSMEGNGNIYYFLGSLHVMRSDVYPLAGEIEKAYRGCEKIVLETNPESFQNPAFQKRFLSAGILPEGQELQETVSTKTYDMFKKKLNAVGLPLAGFERFKAWFCAVTLTAATYQKLGFEPKHGVDIYYYKKAKKDGKQIFFLEPVDYQVRLLDELGNLDPNAVLSQALADIEMIENTAAKMLSDWIKGDVQEIDSLIKNSFTNFPDMYEKLFVARNIMWVSKLEKMMVEKGDALVIVGAGHLLGDQSVLCLMRQIGYKSNQE